MFYDDDDNEDLDGLSELQEQLTAKAQKEFIDGCYEAYNLLATQGKDALKGAEITSIQRAINRMTTFFILQEDYERCGFLKKFVNENMPGFKITPDEEIKKDLNF